MTVFHTEIWFGHRARLIGFDFPLHPTKPSLQDKWDSFPLEGFRATSFDDAAKIVIQAPWLGQRFHG